MEVPLSWIDVLPYRNCSHKISENLQWLYIVSAVSAHSFWLHDLDSYSSFNAYTLWCQSPCSDVTIGSQQSQRDAGTVLYKNCQLNTFFLYYLPTLWHFLIKAENRLKQYGNKKCCFLLLHRDRQGTKGSESSSTSVFFVPMGTKLFHHCKPAKQKVKQIKVTFSLTRNSRSNTHRDSTHFELKELAKDGKQRELKSISKIMWSASSLRNRK